MVTNDIGCDPGTGELFVHTSEGKVVSGPFLDSEKATRAAERIKPEVELGEISLVKSGLGGFEGYIFCIDDVPHIRFRDRDDACKILTAFKRGLVSLIHKRFLGGLGDLIALSGAAVILNQLNGDIVLTSTAKYEHEFRSIFINHPGIRLEVELKDSKDFIESSIADNLLLHNEGIRYADTHMDQYERIYKHFGIPYRYRWDACPVRQACMPIEQLPVPRGQYIFVHDDPVRGFVIDRKRLPDIQSYHPSDNTGLSILAFKDVLENASEVHVFDSVFFHLVECLSPKGKLFFHRYVRPYQKRYSDYKTKYKWEIGI